MSGVIIFFVVCFHTLFSDLFELLDGSMKMGMWGMEKMEAWNSSVAM